MIGRPIRYPTMPCASLAEELQFIRFQNRNSTTGTASNAPI